MGHGSAHTLGGSGSAAFSLGGMVGGAVTLGGGRAAGGCGNVGYVGLMGMRFVEDGPHGVDGFELCIGATMECSATHMCECLEAMDEAVLW